jgi:osmotically-inducible protein OsmY
MSSVDGQQDTTLVDRIHSAMDRHPHVRPDRIRFEAESGRVMIRGRVESYFEKQMAQEAIRSIDGISAIENQIEVAW